ncbi:MAG TPA: response regulator [Casimicrobiaceae bacterium]|nr:response regulator [Casimicrobiaceae bacterium]
MADPAPVVYVVDDDAAIRDALCSLLHAVDVDAQAFDSAQSFLVAPRLPRDACLVLDVRLPGFSGLDLQETLARNGETIPIIFISGHSDVPTSVQAMKAGAAEFLVKPFDDEALLNAIREALARSHALRVADQALLSLVTRCRTLTNREREVMALIVTGLLNKQAAAQLGLSEITVKVHRRRVMEKMNAGSLAELVRMCDRLERAGKRITDRV